MFRFLGFEVIQINYILSDNDIDSTDEDFESVGYNVEAEKDYYKLILVMRILRKCEDNRTVELDVALMGKFDFEDMHLPTEEKIDIVKNNGSAILFPYMRSIIHNITSFNSTKEYINIPVVNIQKIIEEIDSNNK